MEEKGGGEFPLSPKEGTYVIGSVNAISAIIAIGTIQMFGRRTILISGQFFMALWLFLCGLSVYCSWNLASFIMLNLFITSF